MSNIITKTYEGMQVDFTDAGWFNATVVAKRFGKRVDHWMENADTDAYIRELGIALNTRKRGDLIRTARGRNGGSWFHPKLGVAFARWLDIRFAIWCDMQIDGLLRGEGLDHKRLRHEAAASFKVMNAIRKAALEAEGKEPKRHHFINEARLVNYALTGEFSSQDREAMTIGQLDALAKIEERNAVLIGMGQPYDQRKAALQSFATQQIRG